MTDLLSTPVLTPDSIRDLGSTPRLVVGVCRPTWPARWRCEDRGALQHAVEVHRAADELDGEPELAVCGAIVAATALPWSSVAAPAPAQPCPECAVIIGHGSAL